MKQVDGNGVVICLIELHFAASEADQAIQMLQAVVEPIKAKSACQGCWISRDVARPHRVRYSEIWDAEPDFQTHVRSDEFRHVLMALDMCNEEPAVTIGRLSGRQGFEYLENVRGGSAESRGPNQISGGMK